MSYNHGNNHTYYNLRYSNTSDQLRLAYFDIPKDIPLLKDPTKYNFIINKLFVNTRSIPRQFMYITPFNSFTNPTGDPNKSLYYVDMAYNNGGTIVNKFQYIEWVSQSNVAPVPPALTADAPYQQLETYWDYYSINSIQYFLDLINTALAGCVTQLKAAVPALNVPAFTAPVFTLTPETGLISLTGPAAYYSSQTATNLVGVSMNFRLRTLMKNFRLQQVTSNLFQFVFIDDPSPATTSTCKQECVQLDSFSNAFTELLVLSSSFNVAQTYTDNPNDVGQNQTSGQGLTNLSVVNTSGLINSFSVSDSPAGNANRVSLTYNPTAEFRRLSFLGNAPINRVQLQVKYRDTYGNELPLYLDPGDTIDILIEFEKIIETTPEL